MQDILLITDNPANLNADQLPDPHEKALLHQNLGIKCLKIQTGLQNFYLQ